MPLAIAHGAALIALTIDEVGMAKTAERKVEIAQRIHELACDEHGLDPEALIFDVLTFTLTTGDEEWRPSAVETIEGIRRIKAEIPGVKTSLGVSNVSLRRLAAGARAVLNSVFLHHCVEAGLDLAMVNPNHITPYGEIPDEERELADDLVFNRREDALEQLHRPLRVARATRTRTRPATRPRAWSPRRRCTSTSCAARRTGVEDWIDRSVEKIGAVPTLNEVLLPAMKEVGDKFGAGELILPFVLQSAEVMKRAVARLENYLDRIEGHTKGTVVIATVFGDVHDIGKSLVNTILTNNGYTVVDLGKQVPVDTIIDAAVEHEADAIGLSRAARLDLQADAALPSRSCTSAGLEFPVLIGGAAINRDFGRRALYPHGKESDDGLRARASSTARTPSRASTRWTQLVDERRARGAGREDPRRGRGAARQAGRRSTTRRRPTDDSVRSAARTDNPIPTPPFWGVREIDVDLDEVYPTSTATCSSSSTGAAAASRARPGDASCVRGGLPAAARAHVARAGLPAPAGAARLLPLQRRRQRARRLRPRGPRDASSSASSSRASRKHDRICLADFYRPIRTPASATSSRSGRSPSGPR